MQIENVSKSESINIPRIHCDARNQNATNGQSDAESRAFPTATAAMRMSLLHRDAPLNTSRVPMISTAHLAIVNY